MRKNKVDDNGQDKKKSSTSLYKFRVRNKRKLKMQSVTGFVYFGEDGADVEARIMIGDRSSGALKNVRQSKLLSYNSKLRVYIRVVRPTEHGS